LSSAQDVVNGVAAQLGLPGPGISVIDADGELTPDTLEVLALVAEHDAVLVTHAMEELAGPNLDATRCAELAELGASIELCALTCVGALATRPVGDLV